jgi:hypothetical protein
MRRATAALLAIGLLGTSAAAEDIGIAVLVRPQVLAFPKGQHSHDLVERDPIERGMKVTLTGKEAFLLVSFTRVFGCKPEPLTVPYDGQKIVGVLTFVGPGDAELGDRARSCVPKVRLSAGKALLALLRGEPPIDVDTPETRSVVHGTYVRFLVDPIVGTFVGVDEGVVTVQAKAGGDPVEVEAGQWVLVRPGSLATHPAPLQVLEDSDYSDIPLRDFSTQPPGRPRR